MNSIVWHEETTNKKYPRFTASINEKTVAFANFVPLSKDDQGYSYHHAIVKELDAGLSKEFTAIDKCKEYTQKLLDQVVEYAKTRKLVWHYQNSNEKQCYLIFENSNLALASVVKAVVDMDDEDLEYPQETYHGYLFLFSVDSVIANNSYELLKRDVLSRIQKSLESF